MGSVIVAYKIFPADITTDLNELIKKIESALPKFASIQATGQEPVAYGLNALIAQIKIPEDQSGILDELEKELEGISEISQVQTIAVRRVSR